MDVPRAVDARNNAQESIVQPSDLGFRGSVAAANTTRCDQQTKGDAQSPDASEPLFDKSMETSTDRSTANARADHPPSSYQAVVRHRPVAGCVELQVSTRYTIRSLICTDGCSPSVNSRQRVLVLVALNAAHVVLGVSAGSLAAGAYAVAAASANVASDLPSAAACLSSATYAVTGAFGLCQLLVCRRRTRRRRGQRVAYTCLSAYSGIAALITSFFVVKQLAELAATLPAKSSIDSTKSANDSVVPLATCGSILLVLAVAELAVAGMTCYRQSWQRRGRHRFGKHTRYLATDVVLHQRQYKGSVTAGDAQRVGNGCDTAADQSATAAVAGEEDAGAEQSRHGERGAHRRIRMHRSQKGGAMRMAKVRRSSDRPEADLPQAKSKNAAIRSRKLGLLLLMFNATHAAAGLCTLELALVGMTLAGKLNIADFTSDSSSSSSTSSDTAGLFIAALVSPLFLAAGGYGLYAIFTGRLTVVSVRGAYVGICSAAAVGGTTAAGILASAYSKQPAVGSGQLEWKKPKLVLECLVWLATGVGVIACITAIVVTLYFTRRIRNTKTIN